MIFVFIMPVAIGYYGNYLIPLLIGTSELSMPRINGIILLNHVSRSIA